jgi:hypothetical protein
MQTQIPATPAGLEESKDLIIKSLGFGEGL